ncbi:MAG: alpha/beta hydrolase [Chloroflexales bacterium]|nr:alpha/beta hydrolase [Chloroflexales bacterium]
MISSVSNTAEAERPTLGAQATSEKYQTYRAEVEAQLAGQLSAAERKRLTDEQGLLEQARFVKLNGVVHHYMDYGPRDGEPLVLVHGWDCSSYWWHYIIDPMVAAGYRVILYDLRGHGFSNSDPDQGYRIADFSDDLRELGNVLQLSAHHVAAFSLGAFVALHYAAHNPERVRSLVFFNFSLLTYNRVAAAMTPATLDFVFNKMLRPIEKRGLWWIPYVYARLVLSKNPATVSDIKLATLSLRCCDPQAIRVSAEELARRDVLDDLPEQMRRVQQPTLLVAGAGDPIMRPQDGRKLMQLAPHGQYLEVPRCGHLILFELPDQVVQILRLFLRGVR